MDIVYLYDGTFEGLLSAIFDSFEKKVRPIGIVAEKGAQILLDAEYIRVETDEDKWRRVSKGITSNISEETQDMVYKVFLSEHNEHGIIIFDYLKLAFRMGPNVNNHLTDDRVLNVVNLSRKVGMETHLFTGFTRFRDIGGGILYSEIEPTYNIVALLMPYFCDRMPEQRFIIGDVKRNLYGIYNSEQIIFADNIPMQFKTASEGEGDYEKLWKKFFETIAIKERESRSRQISHMPKKYWKHITEKMS